MSGLGQGRRTVLGTAIGISAAAAAAGSAQAADITVTTTADSGDGSLREAINTANLTPATSDRILFQSGLSGTISPLADLPALEGPTDIEGPGMDQMKIDAGGVLRIFQSNSDTSISGLTLANGYVSNAGQGNGIEATFSGSGIFVADGDLAVDQTRIEGGSAEYGAGIAIKNGDLTLSNSVVTGNQGTKGGGITVGDGALTITDSEISDNRAFGSGGGVFVRNDVGGGNRSTVSITNSSFTGNRAFSGGGLQAYGPPTTIDSTLFEGNSATYISGAIGLLGYGPTAVTNSTITGNKSGLFAAGMLGLVAGGSFTVESSTITGNAIFDAASSTTDGAGIIQGGGTLKLSNSIVSGNEPGDISSYPDPPNPGEGFPAGNIESSFSLIGTARGANLIESVPGSNITSSDPQLGPLADNGGPTETMLPADDSPVVNKGSSTLRVDQRGLTRPVAFGSVPFSRAPGANGADMGAAELQSTPSNNFSFGKVKLNRKKGVASLQVKVPGAGKVILLGSRVVKKQKKTAKKKSTITLKIKARGKAARKLKKKGKARVKARVRFIPNGGKAKTKSKAVKLVKKKKKKKK